MELLIIAICITIFGIVFVCKIISYTFESKQYIYSVLLIICLFIFVSLEVYILYIIFNDYLIYLLF